VADQGEYTFLPLEKVIYGAGSLARLPGEVERLRGRRALIITGRTLATQTPLVGRVATLLAERHVGTYAGIRQHVPESGIHEAVTLARAHQADVLVSIGGGSPIDAAKAVARTLGYIPHIAIPTTLSAAEFSHLAGYTDEATKSKTGFADPRATPRIAILDPEMTLATPMWLWLASGIRALDHAVETLYSPGVHPVNDVLALESIRWLFMYLPRSKSEPENLAVRVQCQIAAWMSFFGPASVQMGLSHNLGRRIGATYDVPHGVASCITLAPVMRVKARTEAARLAPIARVLRCAPEEAPDEVAALAAAAAVARLVQSLDLPHRLRDVNVPESALEAIALAAVSDSPQKTEALEVLRQAW